MTHSEQLEQWVAGKSIHNVELDECCPDFSCCQSSLKWPEHVRLRFSEGSDEDRDRMLVESLCRLLESQGDKVTTSADVFD